MCGIVCALDLKQSSDLLRSQVLEMSKKVRHRGPDWNGIHCGKNVLLAHERLAIVDPASGNQPIYSDDKNLILAANGEIYNHQQLRAQLSSDYAFQTNSDCEIILALYKEKGVNFIDDLNGIFGFVLYDEQNDEYLIARDHMGIIPLYMGWDKHGTFYISSELKALEGICNKIEIFPPGHFMSSTDNQLVKWYDRDWMNFDSVKDNKTNLEDLQTALENAVHRQLMSDVPYGVLLSGGLDSSITSALAKKYSKNRVESNDVKSAWYPQLHSFAVGLKGSPDLIAAQKVADHIDSIHHEITFTVQEGLDAIKDVIYHLETYDVTTIRASTPMYLMARVIKSMGIKMVLSGEGADEIFGGYLYFHKAPDSKEFHEETVRKLDKLYQYDCLRANKSLAAWGIEGRVPFLDKEFIDVAMRINPKDKMINSEKMEKWVLRKSFEQYLPESVAWRQKEQFSDGVGYDWIDSLKDLVNEKVTDDMFKNAKFTFPFQTPMSKEEYYYRSIFEEHYPSETSATTVPSVPSVACSTPIALEWDKTFKNLNDPSGRSVSNVHNDSY
ncbi:asparagine synthase B [Flavobacteriaceae bacterium]|jgi:asparagine synthase (glutamine-hydrolysing)|nr:asparagine synthase B [Flavobacteriaceae bacterium]MDA7567339.1 asparagine synthase B [Flavobacteriaceae bacterium]MDB2567946.1 asparagine synthase B [Flavobacteriaceae bacterium]MDB4601522.1 asparagine synthase B [Flavobacteriaceae bacterium]MDB9847417.1 asparagine synthase B [Flavobacteriaceae bacterium]|tara:strand:+ start:3820 stop:5484 length:1665 start_codon:yes stop_codon:yes gene_type:complete